MKRLTYLKIGILAIVLLAACGGSKESKTSQNTETTTQVSSAQTEEVDPMKNKGIGPIKEVKLTETIDETLVKKGEEIFKTKCSACHKLDEKYVGPPMRGITKRRTPEWIMNMMVNTQEMLQKDPIAKKLLQEYMTQMSVQVSEEEARAVLEYFRKIDSEK